MATIPQRLPDAYWHLSQASELLNRFIERPTQARFDALAAFLHQYKQVVEGGFVEVPRISSMTSGSK
jgi:hypothetical protein